MASAPAIPRVIAEYGYSAFAGRAQVDLEGALLNADIVGRFLAVGGRAAYLYGWEPSFLESSPRCDTWGNNMLFLADEQRKIRFRVATAYGAQLVTREWTLAARRRPRDVRRRERRARRRAGTSCSRRTWCGAPTARGRCCS